jgi:hypothetical protein
MDGWMNGESFASGCVVRIVQIQKQLKMENSRLCSFYELCDMCSFSW